MADMMRSGALRPDQVAGHRFRHVITNVVGGEELGVSVEAHALEVQAGDRLLLCSDGLTEMLTNEAIAATLDAGATPELAAKQLLAQANERGGRDNITLVIVRFDSDDTDAANPRGGRENRQKGSAARHRLRTLSSVCPPRRMPAIARPEKRTDCTRFRSPAEAPRPGCSSPAGKLLGSGPAGDVRHPVAVIRDGKPRSIQRHPQSVPRR